MLEAGAIESNIKANLIFGSEINMDDNNHMNKGATMKFRIIASTRGFTDPLIFFKEDRDRFTIIGKIIMKTMGIINLDIPFKLK